ncbi:HU family DNA-binding protein [Paenibacillus senegalensis]|uniref:HU family DNA-binding protein n=1 Tax=Paenibacillus senegalensis TaxID=1465766 RepID=UPI000289405D|nr:HU family DNA-binding protein [Paenibacillus senegalensis]
MNNAEVMAKVSEKSGVALEDCSKVLKAFEEVLSQELSNSPSVGGAFDKIYNVVSYFKGKKRQ